MKQLRLLVSYLWALRNLPRDPRPRPRRNADGSQVWELKGKPKTFAAVGDQMAYVNFDGKITAIDIATGQEEWTGSTKVGKKAMLHQGTDQVVVAIDPGDYQAKDDRYSGSYTITRVSAADGSELGSALEGKDLRDYPDLDGQDLVLTDKKATRVMDLATGEVKSYEREEENSDSYYLDGRVLGIAEKDVSCSDAETKEELWSLTLDRSKHGGGFLRSVLSAAVNASNALSSGIYVGHYHSHGSASHVSFSSGYATVGVLGSTLVWPTHGNGVVLGGLVPPRGRRRSRIRRSHMAFARIPSRFIPGRGPVPDSAAV